MRADPAWQAARAIPRTQKLERQRAFGALRQQYGFSEYALHDAAKGLNCTWIADHVDAVLAQTLGHAGLSRPQPGVSGPGPPGALQEPRTGPLQRGEQAQLIPGCASCSSLPSRATPDICCGRTTGCPRSSTGRIRWSPTACTTHQICPADSAPGQQSSRPGGRSSGPALLRATGAGGRPLPQAQTPDRAATPLAWTWDPPRIAIVPREGTPRLEVLCAELAPDAQAIRRLQRQMDRQRRANNPDNYDERGRIKKRGKQRSQVETQQAVSGHPAAQSHPRAQTGRPPQEPAWPPRP